MKSRIRVSVIIMVFRSGGIVSDRNILEKTIRTYAQRRRLTEAAKLLVFTDKPILEIALIAGYESQQSFTDSFRVMYKKAPNRYREEEEFYPLQLRYVLNENPAKLEGETCLWQKIVCATEADIPAWMLPWRWRFSFFTRTKAGTITHNYRI